MKTNNLKIDNLRIEIAILKNTVTAKKTTKGKFVIPVLTHGAQSGKISTANSNISNTIATKSKTNTINSSDYIELDIPACFRIFFGPNKIPANTKFLVAFTAGDINQARIIGLYDTEQYKQFAWTYMELQKKVKRLISAVTSLQKIHGIQQDWTDKE